ncbi:MAG: ABC-2 family transporter protein [Thermoflexales bacterium]|nr:ABC-2 family transporter protein [Thermoflexales bacterium]
MLQIYKRFWAVNWAAQWQYRANLLMYLAYWVVSPIVFLAVWSSIARAQGDVAGLNAGDFTAYYLTLLPVDIVTASITIHILASKIQDGTVSNALLQPVHPVLTNVLVDNVAFKALQLVLFVPIWIALVLLFQPPLTYTLGSLLLSVPVLALGFLANFLLSGIITALAFWTTRVFAINEAYFILANLLGGSFVPLAILPGPLQGLARLLPMQLWLYFPTQVALNRLSAGEIALNTALLMGWLIVLFMVFRAVWNAGLKRFSAVGA